MRDSSSQTWVSESPDPPPHQHPPSTNAMVQFAGGFRLRGRHREWRREASLSRRRPAQYMPRLRRSTFAGDLASADLPKTSAAVRARGQMLR